MVCTRGDHVQAMLITWAGKATTKDGRGFLTNYTTIVHGKKNCLQRWNLSFCLSRGNTIFPPWEQKVYSVVNSANSCKISSLPARHVTSGEGKTLKDV